jgi:hypothetical protein
VVHRTRFACLLPLLVFIVLRAISHAHPPPPPGTLGVFDGAGLDDVLQGIRIPYTRATDAFSPNPRRLHVATGRIVLLEPLLLRAGFLAAAHSRAPPSV